MKAILKDVGALFKKGAMFFLFALVTGLLVRSRSDLLTGFLVTLIMTMYAIIISFQAIANEINDRCIKSLERLSGKYFEVMVTDHNFIKSAVSEIKNGDIERGIEKMDKFISLTNHVINDVKSANNQQ